jgi:hypothetical protein
MTSITTTGPIISSTGDTRPYGNAVWSQLDPKDQSTFSLIADPEPWSEFLHGPTFSGQELELLNISSVPGTKVTLGLLVKEWNRMR